eukprot:scaffold114_cov36-Cyclotella_meneghiniana.AAC.1
MTSVPGITREQLTSMVEMIAESWPMMREEVSDEPNVDSLCCLFCCSDEPDKDSQPVRKEVCACRGDAGYFHVSCLVEFAKTKTKAAMDRGHVNLGEIWMECPTCKQDWTGGTLVDMSKESVSFVCEEYPDDVELKIYALGIKRDGIEFSGTCSVEEQECAAEEVLSAIKEYYNGEELPAFVLRAKMYSYFMLGDIAFDLNELADAIEHYKQCEATARALGYGENDIDMMRIRKQIVASQCALGCEGDRAYYETLLPFSRAIYAKSKENDGEDNQSPLAYGYDLAKTLCELGQLDEAKELLADLHAKAQRVFGTHHYGTQDIKCLLDKISTSRVD